MVKAKTKTETMCIRIPAAVRDDMYALRQKVQVGRKIQTETDFVLKSITEKIEQERAKK